jgi:hypothetical protein
VELRYGRNNSGSIPRWSELWVDFLKNPLAGETGVRGCSKPGEGFFFLMKIVGGRTLAGETGVRGFSKPGEGFFFLMKIVGGLTLTGLVFFLSR